MPKPIKAKPIFYTLILPDLMDIARNHGYNLIGHGSFNRDLDLIAIPWEDTPASHKELLHAFCTYLGAPKLELPEQYLHSMLPGHRYSYVINLNRGFGTPEDPQWYLDISITPAIQGNLLVPNTGF